jgi:energy-coupling factor transporter ATP-binding protein EcfA2
MKLVRLVLNGIRGVRDGTYPFAGVALITGSPASGKTSLLEAVAAAKEITGSYSAPADPRRLLRPGETRGRIEAAWLLSDEEKAHAGLIVAEQTVVRELGEGARPSDVAARLRKLFTAYSLDPEHGKFEYFPAHRRLAAPGRRTIVPAERDPRLGLSNDPDKYLSIRAFLHGLAIEDAARASQLLSQRGIVLGKERPDSLAPFKQAVAALLPDVRLLDIDIADTKASVPFKRRAGAVVDLEELSASEQQAVLLATTFARFGLNHSCVLLDEPELHLHPAEHARLFQAVVGLGTGNQIIAATTSPAILKTVPPDHVIDLDKACTATGEAIRRVEGDR